MSHPLPPGVYPASVTPFTDGGVIDDAGVAKLLAYFEAAGCQGVVLAGTNGEGPSLSAYEKRDLVRAAVSSRGELKLVLGVSTPSLTEAQWLCNQSGNSGADAILLMPPGYFRNAPETGVESWMNDVIDSSPLPVIVYNFPKMTGFTFSADLLGRLCAHENVIGVKDSSGERANLDSYRRALAPAKQLFVGDETLLIEALEAGWSGSISGAANVCPVWMSRVVREWHEGRHDDARAAFSMVLPVVEAVRTSLQPATNKAVLAGLGVIDNGYPRLPLEPVSGAGVLDVLRTRLGVSAENLGLARV